MKKHLILAASLLLSLAVGRGVAAATVGVSYTGAGFSPSLLTINEGDTVVWTNNSAGNANVSSNPHPVHTDYPALNLGDFGIGATVQLTFPTAGTYNYHNHLNAGQGGSITVNAAPTPTPGSQPATAVMDKPNGGETLTEGSHYLVLWGANGTNLSSIRLSLSLDGGTSYAVIASDLFHDGSYDWIVPGSPTTTAKMKVEAMSSAGTVLASDASDANFAIVAAAAPPPPPPPPPPPSPSPAPPAPPPPPSPPPDPTLTGAYSPAEAIEATPTIDVDKGLQPASSPPCVGGTRIKGSGAAVYYCGKDGKRYVFFNEKVYRSWYADFRGVVTIGDALLASIPIGGNVTYRPGVKLVKITSDPRVYAVSRGGTLRWVTSESVAVSLYGPDWNRNVDDLPDSLFFSYAIGEPIQ